MDARPRANQGRLRAEEGARMQGETSLGRFIKECRTNLGYTTRRVEEITRSRPGMVAISHSNLVAIEKGRHIPSYDKMVTKTR